MQQKSELVAFYRSTLDRLGAAGVEGVREELRRHLQEVRTPSACDRPVASWVNNPVENWLEFQRVAVKLGKHPLAVKYGATLLHVFCLCEDVEARDRGVEGVRGGVTVMYPEPVKVFMGRFRAGEESEFRFTPERDLEGWEKELIAP